MAPSKQPDIKKEVIDLTSTPSPSSSPTIFPPSKWQQQGLSAEVVHNHHNAEEEDKGRSEDEDEDLKLAIALSLQQQEQEQNEGRAKQPNNDTTSFHSPNPEATSKPSSTSMRPPPDSHPALRSDPSISGLQALDRVAMEAQRLARLKRKRDATDEEITRMTTGPAKQKQARISPPPLRRPTSTLSKSQIRATSIDTARGVPLSKAEPTAQVSANPASASTSSASSSQPPPSTSPSSAQQTYPFGKVFKTPISSSNSSDANTISLPTVLHPSSTLQSALLSSFTYNFDWLLPHFSTQSTTFLFIFHAPTPQHRDLLTSDFHGVPNVRLCFPPVSAGKPDYISGTGGGGFGGGTMHSKLMILFWEERVRIVVPTGNLVPYDWGEGAEGKPGEVGGWMENMVWLIDLPRLSVGVGEIKNEGNGGHDDTTTTMTSTDVERSSLSGRERDKGKEGDGSGQRGIMEFQSSLLYFLRASTVPSTVISKLQLYDFSNTKNIRFVHSIGGGHTDSLARRNTGHPGLGRAITSLGLSTRSPISVDFVTSSLGHLNEGFLKSIYLACQGDDGLVEFTLRYAKKFPAARLGSVEHSEDEQEVCRETVKGKEGRDWKDNFRIYYPSHSTVFSSKAGPNGAGTIRFSKKWWEDLKFPRSNLRDCASVREGLLMHNKIMFVKFPASASHVRIDGKRCVGWTYVGSANLSESAWGRLVQDLKNSKRTKLNCRNWECGVVIPVYSATDKPGLVVEGAGEEVSNRESLDIFASTVPIPMKVPGEVYQASPTKQPWCSGDLS